MGCLSKCCRSCLGWNKTTFSLLLLLFSATMFVVSVVLTSMNYNSDRQQDWYWVGAVQSTSAAFRVRIPTSEGMKRLFVVSTNKDLGVESDRVLTETLEYKASDNDYGMKSVYATNLTIDTTYYFGSLEDNSNKVVWNIGNFDTPVPEGSRMSFKVALGGCAYTGAKDDTFDEIYKFHDPFLFLNMGDFHYQDISSTNMEDRVTAFDKVMGSPSQGRLYSSQAMSYIWDDHDWVGNDQDGSNQPAGTTAKLSYQLLFPHYHLAALGTNNTQQTSSSELVDVAPYQAFTIGTVRFIILDLRSESRKSNDDFAGSIYSTQQEEWLFQELDNSENYDFVVLVSSRPWTGPAKRGSDQWTGFEDDRTALSQKIASTVSTKKQNLIVVSSDNHMVAYDDGSSTDFSDQTVYPAGFPIIHSGPLSQYGSGFSSFFFPNTNYFTDGCHTVNSEQNTQYSIMEFQMPESSGAEPCIEIKSYKEKNTLILNKKLCGKIMRTGTEFKDTCKNEQFSTTTVALFSVCFVFLALFILYACCCKKIEALIMAAINVIFLFITIGLAVAGAWCFGSLVVDMLSLSIVVVLQSFFALVFLCIYRRKVDEKYEEDYY